MSELSTTVRGCTTLFGKTGHVFFPLMLAKDVAQISRQEVTLLNILYLIHSPLAMLCRR
jgi:hypothetical protein